MKGFKLTLFLFLGHQSSRASSLLVYGDMPQGRVTCRLFLLGTRAGIRKDFADIENLVSIRFFSLISTSYFCWVLRSLTMGTVDTF